MFTAATTTIIVVIIIVIIISYNFCCQPPLPRILDISHNMSSFVLFHLIVFGINSCSIFSSVYNYKVNYGDRKLALYFTSPKVCSLVMQYYVISPTPARYQSELPVPLTHQIYSSCHAFIHMCSFLCLKKFLFLLSTFIMWEILFFLQDAALKICFSRLM